MKYKVTKSDLFLNGRIIPENSEVDLSESDIKGIEDYLIPLAKESHSERSEESPLSHPEPDEGSLNTKTEQKNKTKRGNK